MRTIYDLAREAVANNTADAADLDNALVDQKNKILEYVNAGRLLEAVQYLRFAAQVWRTVSYGYKADELKTKIMEHVRYEQRDTSRRRTIKHQELEAVLRIASSIQ